VSSLPYFDALETHDPGVREAGPMVALPGLIGAARSESADATTLLVELTDPGVDGAAIVESVQAVTKLRGSVSRVAAGSLPGDGKVIEDRRPIG
jgi:hypothetical protein